MTTLSRSRVLAAAAATLALRPTIVPAQALDKIQLAGAPSEDATPLFYAIKSGLYQKAGLDVEYIPASSGSVATTAVVAGAYQMGKGSLIASLSAHLRGLPIAVVALGQLWDPKALSTLMFVAADAPFKSAADFNGKVAATAGLGDLTQLATNVWIDKNGGDSKTLKWVEVPNSASAEALIEHRIDVCCLNEPAIAAAKEDGRVRVFADPYSAIAARFAVTLYFANADWASKNPDIVRRWAHTTYEAAAYANAHHRETEDLMADLTKIPVDTLHKMTRSLYATTTDPALLQPVIDTAARYKNIPSAFPARDMFGGVST